MLPVAGRALLGPELSRYCQRAGLALLSCLVETMAWRGAGLGQWRALPETKVRLPVGLTMTATRGPEYLSGRMAGSYVPASWPAPNGFEPHLPRTDVSKPT